MQGYDLELVDAVVRAVHVPVIASGGAGSYEHMRQAIQEAGASAVAAASMFHFTQQTPAEAKGGVGGGGRRREVCLCGFVALREGVQQCSVLGNSRLEAEVGASDAPSVVESLARRRGGVRDLLRGSVELPLRCVGDVDASP
jgi:hypothetical protein